MRREPVVADRFYPGKPETLAATINKLLPVPQKSPKQKALAVVAPHAGYIYSGSVAAEVLDAVQIPKTVIILGLNHHGKGAPAALSLADWAMPLGDVRVDHQLAELLLADESPLVHDELAHRHEHSVEVQVPLLQVLQPELRIVPIVLSHISYPRCEQIGDWLAGVIDTYPEEVLIVASSDMTHYESRTNARQKDELALSEIRRLTPRGLYDVVHTRRISMCGVIPVTTTLITALQLGATRAEVIRYTDSGEVSGDSEQVVGYAGVVVQ